MNDEEPDSTGLQPFDLQPPARLMYPLYTGIKEGNANMAVIDIGIPVDGSRFTLVKGNDGSVTAWVRVPCAAMVHDGCVYCECDDSHTVYLTQAQLRQLRGLLNDSA